MSSSEKLYIQMSSNYAPSWGFGGPMRIFYDYANFLKDHFETIVLTGNINHDYKKISKNDLRDLENRDIKIIRFHTFFRFLVRRGVNFISPRLFIYAFLKVFNSKKQCVIHLWELRGILPIYAKILKVIFNDKVEIIHSGFGQLHDSESIFRKIYDPLFLKWTFSSFKILLGENNHEIQEYEKLKLKMNTNKQNTNLTKLLPLHVKNILKISQINSSLESKLDLRRKFNLPIDATILLTLSRFNKKKGLKRIHEYAQRFATISNKPTYMIFAGKDEGFKEELIAIKSSSLSENYQIKIIENLFSDDRFDLYMTADVFLGFPIIYEETMLASLEALAVGTPVIVSKEASIPFLKEYNAGIEIDSPSIDDCNSLNKIFLDYESYSEGAKKIIEEVFLDQKVFSDLKSIIEKISYV